MFDIVACFPQNKYLLNTKWVTERLYKIKKMLHTPIRNDDVVLTTIMEETIKNCNYVVICHTG
jgi:hypothetical protein